MSAKKKNPPKQVFAVFDPQYGEITYFDKKTDAKQELKSVNDTTGMFDDEKKDFIPSVLLTYTLDTE